MYDVYTSVGTCYIKINQYHFQDGNILTTVDHDFSYTRNKYTRSKNLNHHDHINVLGNLNTEKSVSCVGFFAFLLIDNSWSMILEQVRNAKYAIQ